MAGATSTGTTPTSAASTTACAPRGPASTTTSSRRRGRPGARAARAPRTPGGGGRAGGGPAAPGPAGGAARTKLRKAADPFSYFRRSSGPGWALVGDAGHFKDPVIAQGVRDAIYYGRRLGMTASAALDNPTWLDRRLYDWELQRDRDCIISYHFALRLSLTHPVSPVEMEMWKTLEPNYELSRELGDTFSRKRSAESLLNYPHLIHWTAKAFVNPAYPKMEVMTDVARELGVKARLYRDLGRIARRKRVLGHNWDAWGGEMRTTPDGPENAATPGQYVPAAVPQRSDLLAEEGEVTASKSKVKETVR